DLEGVYFPAAQWQAAEQSGHLPRDPLIMAIAPHGNVADDASNIRQFTTLRASWNAAGKRVTHRDARRIAAALERWRGGTHLEMDAPALALKGDESVPVEVETSDPRVMRLIMVARDPDSRGGAYHMWSSAMVLVRGRIVNLEWGRRGFFSIRTLAEVSDN